MSRQTKPRITEAPQRSDQWYKDRLGNLTASRVKDCYISFSEAQVNAAIRVIMDVARIDAKVKATPEYQALVQKDPFDLLEEAKFDIPETEKRKKLRQETVAERLTGMRADEDGYVNNDMKWGIVNEAYAVALYQMEQKCIVDNAPFMRHATLACGASPDGHVTEVSTGELGNIEVKCLRSANHLYKVIATKEVPEEFYDQIQMQMWINGRDWCDFVAYDSRVPAGLTIFVKRVPYDEEYVEGIMVPAVTRFLKECDRDERMFRKIIRERGEAK